MTLKKMTKPPYYKRQPRGHISSSFCDGKYKITDAEIVAHLFFAGEDEKKELEQTDKK